MNHQHLLPEQSVNCLYTKKVSNILTKKPYVLHNPRKEVSLIRTAWIRYGQHDRTKAEVTKSEQLIQNFSEKGLDIWILNTENISSEEISCFDFIFLEHQGAPKSLIKSALLHLRQQVQSGKSAPLVILADDPFTECSVDLIEAGADELFPISMDNKVIVARCRALLDRCYHIL